MSFIGDERGNESGGRCASRKMEMHCFQQLKDAVYLIVSN